MGKTYAIAACASGCAYHSTVGGACAMCGGPMSEPRTVTAEQAREIMRGGEAYNRGKAAAIAQAATTNRRAHR